MNLDAILSAIDVETHKLRHVRGRLAEGTTSDPSPRQGERQPANKRKRVADILGI